MNKKYVLLALAILVVAVIVWLVNRDKQTTDWQIYMNKELGISFQYPADVTVTPSMNDETGVSLIFPNNQYELRIVQPMGGVEGYSTQLTGYEDKVIVPNQGSRTINGYDSDGANDVRYIAALAGDGRPKQTWVAVSYIEKPQLNQSIINTFDQIASSFKLIR